MEKVPTINLFNSSSSSTWRHQPYQVLNYSQNSSNGFTQPPQISQNARSNPPIWSQSCTCDQAVRCSSLSSLNRSTSSKSMKRPGQYNYYDNAVRICEDNLRRIPKQRQANNDIGGLKKFSFLQFGGRRPNYQHDLIANTRAFRDEHDLDVYRKEQLINQTNRLTPQDQNVLNQEANNNSTHNSSQHTTFWKEQKIVSFKQITNIVNPPPANEQLPAINVNNNMQPITANLDTVRSKNSTSKGEKLIINAIKISPKVQLQRKIAQIQAQLPGQQLLNFTDDLVGSDKFQRDNEYMLDDLSDLKRQNIQLDKDYIHKIDEIIENFGTLKERDLIMSKSTGSLHKRKKLFVTQAPAESPKKFQWN